MILTVLGTLGTIGQVTAGVLAAFLGIYKAFLGPYLRRKKNAALQEKLQQEQFLTSLKEDLTSIKKQVHPNGGESVIDKINNVSKSITRIESSIASVEDTQRVVMNLQKIAFWRSNADGEWTDVSPALCNITGHSESELLGNNWLGTIYRDDVEKIEEAWQRAIKMRSPFDEIYRIKKSDGAIVQIEALAFPKGVGTDIMGTLKLTT